MLHLDKILLMQQISKDRCLKNITVLARVQPADDWDGLPSVGLKFSLQ